MAIKYIIPFKSYNNSDWRIDISDTYPDFAVFNISLFEQSTPEFIDANVKVIIDGVIIKTLYSAETDTYKVPLGQSYSIGVVGGNDPTGPDPKIRMTIDKDDVIIFDKIINASTAASMLKTGIASGGLYNVHVITVDTLTPNPNIDIDDNTYSNQAITLRGVKETHILTYSPDDVDDPFSPVVKSSFKFSVYNQDNINVKQLRNGQDRDFPVNVYENSILYWAGFLICDGLQSPLQSNPTKIDLTASDGLSLLPDMPYQHADLNDADGNISRCPINYFRQILYANLDVVLPIRWSNSVRCTAFPNSDVMSGDVQWAVDNEGFYSFQASQSGGDTGIIQNCDYIIRNILASFQCRIYQSAGKWVIRRVNDVVSGQVNYSECAATLGNLAVQSARENILYQIGRSGYPFLNENALIGTLPGLKTCQVTYNATVRENIIPNGNQDQLTHDIDQPILYWGCYETPQGVFTQAGLDGRVPGNSALIINDEFAEDRNYTLLSGSGTLKFDGLPIDTNTLIPVIDFSFYFEPAFNFPVDPSTGFIDWSSNPFTIQVIFNVGIIQYYLNQFGFWQTDEVDIPIVVDGLSIGDIAKIEFNAFQNIIMPTPTRQPQAGDTSDIQFIFKVKNTYWVALDNISVSIAPANDVYESTYVSSKNTSVDKRQLAISSSFGGYMVSNYMTNWSKSDTECFYTDGLIYGGTLTGLTANAIMRYRYKSSDIFNGDINVRAGAWKFDNIYLIDGMALEKFLPLNAAYNIERCEINGMVNIECRNENPILVEKYYSSNDQTLSN